MFVLAFTYSYKLRSQFIIIPVLQLDIGKIKNNMIPMFQLPERLLNNVKTCITHEAWSKSRLPPKHVYNPQLYAAVPYLIHKYFPSHKYTQITVVSDGYCIF